MIQPIVALLHGPLKPAAPPVVEPRIEHDPADLSRIRCPLCRWQPKPSDRWCCVSSGAPEMFSGGCGTVWHTFDTHGRCPGCGHQWLWTCCLECHQWSRHEDWYESPREDGR